MRQRLLPLLAASPLQELAFRQGEFLPVFVAHRLAQPEHGIRGHQPEQLREQLEWLRRHRWQLLSLSTALQHLEEGRPLPSRSVVFTIDDGFQDQYDMAMEIFGDYDCPLTLFVITGFLDGALWPWDDQLLYLIHHCPLPALNYQPESSPDSPPLHLPLGDEEQRRQALYTLRDHLKLQPNHQIYDEVSRLYRLAEVEQPSGPPRPFWPMRWDQARDLVRRGHHLAPHGVSHRILTRLNHQEARREISNSRQIIEDRTGFSSSLFAYPTGRSQDYGQREMALLEDLGFTAGLTTEPGHLRPHHLTGPQRYALPRFGLPTSLADFCQYLSWIEMLKDEWRRLRRR